MTDGQVKSMPMIYRGGRHTLHCNGERHYQRWGDGSIHEDGKCGCKPIGYMCRTCGTTVQLTPFQAFMERRNGHELESLT